MTKLDLINKYQVDHAGQMTFSKDDKKPTLIVFTDVDGVLTNGQLSIIDGQKLMNTYSVKDGHGVQLLQENGILVVFLTKRAAYTNRNHRQRARLLEVPFFEIRDTDTKEKVAEEFVKYCCAIFGCDRIDYAAIGDDIHDLGMLKQATIAGCPHNAHEDVLAFVRSRDTGIVVPKSHKPGMSCFRYFAEVVLNATAARLGTF